MKRNDMNLTNWKVRSFAAAVACVVLAGFSFAAVQQDARAQRQAERAHASAHVPVIKLEPIVITATRTSTAR